MSPAEERIITLLESIHTELKDQRRFWVWLYTSPPAYSPPPLPPPFEGV